tara:strand:+ start:12567 stop:13202 length:636 start_codon:yes stop_codon:yes gene_type:complete
MTKQTLKEIANLIPNGLSEEGMEEISSLLENHVAEQVNTKVSKMETRVASLFRTKIDNLKEVAYNELVNEDANIKAIKTFDAIMGVVGEYVESEMIDSKLEAKNQVIKEQQDILEEMEVQLNDLLTENTRLSKSITVLTEETSSLNEQLITTKDTLGETEQLLSEGFHSSESAFVIANDNSTSVDSVSLASADNPLLTEEMLELTKSVLHS